MVKMIKVEDSTHHRLTVICAKDESYDKLINRILDALEKGNAESTV